MASYTTTTTTSNDEIFTSLKTPPLPPTKVNASCNHEIAHAVEETSTLESIHSFNSMNETVNLEEGREVKMNETNEGGENDEFMKPIQVTVLLPNNCKLTIPVLRADTVGFLLQSVVDHPSLVSYSCATLNHANQPLMEAQELGTIFKNQFDKTDEFSLTLTPSMYGERDVRVHLMRVRNLLYHSTLRIHPGHFALDTGISLFQSITAPHQITGDVSSIMNIPKNDTLGHPNGFQWDQAELGPLLTSSCVPPLSQKDTVDFGQEVSIGISGWNPPPAWRRIRGDFLYVQATFPHSQPLHITAFCKGFYKNRSTNEIFDPIADSPTFHSLLDLLSHFSPTFEKKLQTWLPLSTDIAPTLVPEKIPILTALPQANWQVTMSDQPSFSTDHVYDPLRGLGGLSGGETMLDTTAMDSVRDWNEEFQLYRTQLFSMTSSHPENFNGSSSALASDTHAPSTVTAASFVHFRHSTMVYTQFVHMAIQGALGILSGSIPPISLPDPTLFDSPRHPEEELLYFWNNLFFSFAEANAIKFQMEGGHIDPVLAARVHAAKDLKAMQHLESFEFSGIHVMPMVIVDLQGHRILVQGVLPGIIGNPNGAKIIYGSVEDPDVFLGATVSQREVKSDPSFHILLSEVAKKMMWKEHKVIDEKSKQTHTLFSSAETKGIIGHDGRHYLFDLTRSAPLDQPFLELAQKDPWLPYLHRLTLLRFELLTAYQEFLTQSHLKNCYESEKQRILASHKSKKTGITSESPKDSTETVSSSAPIDPKASTTVLNEEEKADVLDDETQENDQETTFEIDLSPFLETSPQFRFNPDQFSSWSIQPEDTTLDPHETPEELAQLYTYLYDRVIPTFVEDLSKVISIPTSGLNLTNILHSRGISMRHLGIILTTVDNERSSKKTVPGILLRLDALSLLLKREMWLRCFKHLVRHYLKINHNSKSLISPTHVIAHLFTSFLSIDSMNIQDCENSNNNSKKINHEHPHSHKNKKTISSENSTMEKVWTQPILCPASYLDITSSFLRSYLLQQVSIRYRYQLSTDFDFLVVKHVMLREICLRLGVQLKAQPYAPHYCIKEEDVLNLVPLVKSSPLKYPACQSQLEFAQALIQNGKLGNGLAALEHAYYMYEQCFSPMHLDTLFVQSCLADVYHTLYNDQKEHMYLQCGLELQRNAVIGFERLAGVDAYEVASGYFVLSTMEFSAGEYSQALKHLNHAAKLYHIIYGPNHPDWMPHLSLFAKLFVKFQRLDLSIHAWTLLKNYYVHHLGPDEPATASAYFHLSQYLFAYGQHPLALSLAKKAYVIWNTRFGDQDPRTRESLQLLNAMTKQFVQSRSSANTVISSSPSPSASSGSTSTINSSSSTSAMNAKGKVDIGKPSLTGSKKKSQASPSTLDTSTSKSSKVSSKASLSIEEQIAYINGNIEPHHPNKKKSNRKSSHHHGKSSKH